MDVKDSSTFVQGTATLKNKRGHTYHYVDQPAAGKGLAGKATCVLLHGFPDLWYGWRYQIKALSSQGYRVICPSQLGYAGSSQPDDLQAYTYRNLAEDLNELLDVLSAGEQILLFGHDWGGLLAWRFANYYPQRVRAIATVCTPYMPPAQPGDTWTPPDRLVHTRLPNFGYQLFFASDEGRMLMQRNIDNVLVPMFSQFGPPKSASGKTERDGKWVLPGEYAKRLDRIDRARQAGHRLVPPAAEQEPELAFYLRTYKASGILHPLNYYRTQKLCFEQEQHSGIPAAFPAQIPAYFLTGDSDEALPLAMSDNSPRLFKGEYSREILPGADHWLLQHRQYRDEASARLIRWADANSGSHYPLVEKAKL